MIKNRKKIALLMGLTSLLLAGCSDAMRAYNPLDENAAPIEGYENAQNYSWNQASNGYSDPYDEVQEQDNNTSYRVQQTAMNMPGSPAYFTSQIGNVVHFDVDSIDLNEEAKAILNKQAQWLARYHHKIVVEGYTDDRGTKVYNIALGKHRASSVKEYLTKLGIPSASIKTVSYGLERPAASCEQERCWAQNRRARVVLY